VGKRHLEAAAKNAGVQVVIRWEPFFLNENTPREGVTLKDYIAAKYGPQMAARLSNPNNPLSSAGRAVGINFITDRKMYPTMDCHRIFEYLYAKGDSVDHLDKVNVLAEVIFKRYFEEGMNLTSVDLLVDCVKNAGFDDEEGIRSLLSGSDFTKEVKQKDRYAKSQLQVDGVPYFIIENKKEEEEIVFSGAQPIHFIQEALVQATK